MNKAYERSTKRNMSDGLETKNYRTGELVLFRRRFRGQHGELLDGWYTQGCQPARVVGISQQPGGGYELWFGRGSTYHLAFDVDLIPANSN